MNAPNSLNIFIKTRYSLPEEDRVLNGLLVVLQHCPPSVGAKFLAFLGTPVDHRDALSIQDHIRISPNSVVDGELMVPGKLLVAIEAKIHKNQLEDPEQATRYFDLLLGREEKIRALLLLSPDEAEPLVVTQASGQSPSCYIIWRSWGDVHRLLERERVAAGESSQLARFLIGQYLEYLDALGLKVRDGDWSQGQGLVPQLRFLLGNVASEKVLLHLYHHGGGNVASIARDHALGIGATVRVLDRFVKAGLVRRERRGRVVWYTFETKNPIVRPLLEMLRQVYDSIPEPLRRAAFDPEYTPDF